ncbi:hypothetical protein ACSSS7_005752 [Eimeria intestinalis]
MLRCVPLAVGPPSSPVCFKGKQQGLTQRLRARGIRDTGRRSHAIPRQLSPFSSTGQSSHGVWPPRGSPLPAGHWQTSEGPTSAAALWEQRQALHLSCLDVKDTSRVASEAATAAVRAAAAAAAMTTAAATTTTAAAAAAAVAATQPYALRLRNIFRWGGVATVSADPHSSSSSSSSSGSSGLLFPSWGVRTPQEGLKDLTLGRAAAAIREAVEGCALLLWKGNKWRGEMHSPPAAVVVVAAAAAVAAVAAAVGAAAAAVVYHSSVFPGG